MVRISYLGTDNLQGQRGVQQKLTGGIYAGISEEGTDILVPASFKEGAEVCRGNLERFGDFI